MQYNTIKFDQITHILQAGIIKAIQKATNSRDFSQTSRIYNVRVDHTKLDITT